MSTLRCHRNCFQTKQNIIGYVTRVSVFNIMSQRMNKLPVKAWGHFDRFACPYKFCKINKLRSKPVKKVIASRKLGFDSSEVKSRSTGILDNNKTLQYSRERKSTRSVKDFDHKGSNMDFCRKCGDSVSKNRKNNNSNYTSNALDSFTHNIETQVAIDKERSKTKTQQNKSIKVIQEYYKNENFKPSTSSVKDFKSKTKNKYLKPVEEKNKDQGKLENSADPIYEIYPESTEEIGYLDPEDSKSIEDLKEFRKKNYFECHSAKSRISNKGSVTSLNNHKCTYRFYLNDRLFPVPLQTDHHDSIRCVECHLPIDDINSNSEHSINGTVQTKVKIGNEVQDTIIMLPVKKPLIVQQKKRFKNNRENDVLYFGVVKLNYDGDSMFSRTVPCDSLALKYQKGYKLFVDDHRYQYEKIHEDDVIIN